jgi:hypothetical protein
LSLADFSEGDESVDVGVEDDELLGGDVEGVESVEFGNFGMEGKFFFKSPMILFASIKINAAIDSEIVLWRREDSSFARRDRQFFPPCRVQRVTSS